MGPRACPKTPPKIEARLRTAVERGRSASGNQTWLVFVHIGKRMGYPKDKTTWPAKVIQYWVCRSDKEESMYYPARFLILPPKFLLADPILNPSLYLVLTYFCHLRRTEISSGSSQNEFTWALWTYQCHLSTGERFPVSWWVSQCCRAWRRTWWQSVAHIFLSHRWRPTDQVCKLPRGKSVLKHGDRFFTMCWICKLLKRI